MRIKLDENLPVRLIAGLSGLGHDVESVHSESVSGVLDPELWALVQNEGRAPRGG